MWPTDAMVQVTVKLLGGSGCHWHACGRQLWSLAVHTHSCGVLQAVLVISVDAHGYTFPNVVARG